MKCLFCEFAQGRKKEHDTGFPFSAIHQTGNTLAFVCTDIPAAQDGHLLVIPKKHYSNLEDVPKKILNELIGHVKLASKIVRKKHQGCNILLNNGKSAGQHISHIHFHIIPRDKGDRIEIDQWKTKKMTKEYFEKLNAKFKKSFQKHKSF